MALTVKQLNSDASFLLSFEPLLPDTAQETVTPRPFTILLDPWLTGPSEIFHKKISTSTQKEPPCVASLLDLPEPDLVIISQHKSDHCNEATLRQLPARNTKTLILAEPASAKLIRSWRHFSNGKVKTIPRWQDPRLTGKEAVLRIPVPAVGSGGHRGEVTIAFIPQKRDIAGLHSAIGITYRPPSTHNLVGHRRPSHHVVTPPSRSPSPFRSTFQDFKEKLLMTNPHLLPPSPPQSAHSLRSCRSASTLAASSPTWPEGRSESPQPTARPVSSLYSSHLLNVGTNSKTNKSATSIPSTTSHCHPVSVIFAPHGISYSTLEPYATSHLVAEAALPLTALMHCMNSVDNPWWMGGNINAGALAGAVTAAKLGARIWVGAHDGDKDIRGLATGMLKTTRYRRHEMRQVVAKANGVETTMAGRAQPRLEPRMSSSEDSSTEILQLSSGEEVLVSGDGAMLWCPSTEEHDVEHPSDFDAQVGAASITEHIRNHEHNEQDKSRKRMSMPKAATKAGLRARASMSFLTHRLKMS